MAKANSLQINTPIEFELFKNYSDKILPLLEKCETKRKKALKKMIITECILLTVLIVLLFNINFLTLILMYFIVPAILVLPFTAAFEFKKKLKKIFAPELSEILNLSDSFESINYSNAEYNIFSTGELVESTLFGMFNSVNPDDSFCGNYKGVKFKTLETELIQRGRKYSFQIFKGVIISFDFNKKIKAKTTVTTSRDLNVKNNFPIIQLIIMMLLIGAVFNIIFLISIGILNPETISGIVKGFLNPEILPIIKEMALILSSGTLFFIAFLILCLQIRKKQLKRVNTNNKKINLEDPEFIKQFHIQSEDEIEARYLVTPAFMERFLNLTTAFGTKNAKCSFYSDKIMIAISTRKDLFECGTLYKPFTESKNIKLFKELQSILDLIDYFKLNEKTGL